MNSKASPTLMVATDTSAARIKITGRACFSHSVDFKNVVTELRNRGMSHLALDLTDCATMDSTFLGVLAGLAMNAQPQPPADLQLINPNPRVADLLDNLGIAHLFQIVTSCEKSDEALRECRSMNASKQELCKESLEAHQVLMQVNPENVAKFKDVAEFLMEDLKKSPAPPEPEQAK